MPRLITAKGTVPYGHTRPGGRLKVDATPSPRLTHAGGAGVVEAEELIRLLAGRGMVRGI